MPGKNVIKYYIPGGFYHLYNRCTSNEILFHTDRDYRVILRLLKKYLAPECVIDPVTGLRNSSSLAGDIDLLSFCLMPNHFHFLVRQHGSDGITKFSRGVLTSYAMYYNAQNNRQGSLFEGKLRGILVEGDSYLLHLSRYIHRNPLALQLNHSPLVNYQYSSYPNFLGMRKNSWIKPGAILNYFSSKNKILSYQSFVENEDDYHHFLTGLTLED